MTRLPTSPNFLFQNELSDARKCEINLIEFGCRSSPRGREKPVHDVSKCVKSFPNSGIDWLVRAWLGRLTNAIGVGKDERLRRAQAAWQAGDPTRAERLFEQAVEEYKRREPSGVDFALGRYGAFLLDQDRKDDALRVLEQAIERKTDIPAIWSDYMRIVSDHRDIDALKRGIELMAKAVKYRVEPEFVLMHSRRADREGASAFAEAIAQWVVERAARDGDKEGRWAAVGDIGRILERAGRLDEAVNVWWDAFDEGSRDPDTAFRLSMHLERAKDCAAAMAVIREAIDHRIERLSNSDQRGAKIAVE